MNRILSILPICFLFFSNLLFAAPSVCDDVNNDNICFARDCCLVQKGGGSDDACNIQQCAEAGCHHQPIYRVCLYPRQALGGSFTRLLLRRNAKPPVALCFNKVGNLRYGIIRLHLAQRLFGALC